MHVPEHFSNSEQWQSHTDPGLLVIVEGQAAAEAAPRMGTFQWSKTPLSSKGSTTCLGDALTHPLPFSKSRFHLTAETSMSWSSGLNNQSDLYGGLKDTNPYTLHQSFVLGKKKSKSSLFSDFQYPNKKVHKDVNAFLQFLRRKKKIYSPGGNWKQICKNNLSINILFFQNIQTPHRRAVEKCKIKFMVCSWSVLKSLISK